MNSSTRIASAGHLFSVVAFGAVVVSGLTGHSKAGLAGGDDGGLGIPGLGNSTPQSCTLTSSDPRQKNSCNSRGGNGESGEAGYVHGDASGDGSYRDDADYRADPAFEDYMDGRY